MNGRKCLTMDDILITLDVDWAPDFIIRDVAELLRSAGVRSTWFATHESEAIRELEKDPLFEIGIHPASYTTDGMKDSMREMKRLFPQADSLRTHGLFHSSILRHAETVDHGIRIDSSTYLREMPHISPFYTYYDSKPLLSVPFFWTEDGEMYAPGSSFQAERIVEVPGLKVLDYHPVHIWLNSRTMDRYNGLKAKLGPPTKWTEKDLAGGRPEEGARGAGDHFKDMLEICRQRGSMTLKELAERMD